VSELKGVMVGAGFFAAYQAEAWNRVPGVRIAAVADLDGQRARDFAARWKIPGVYTDAAAMLERERPDFVDIVTGPETHRGLVELGAQARVAVICQKPLAPTREDCAAMVEACERAGVRFMVHENWRWQPWYREIKRVIQTNVLGRLFYLGFRMRNGDGRGPDPYTLQPYFRNMKRFLIFETLVHFLDTFRFLGGEIGRVYCRTSRVNPIIAGEDCAVIHLDFENGMQGVIDANRISGPLPLSATFGDLRLEGDRAMLRMTHDGRLWLTEYGSEERAHDYDIPQRGYRGDSVRAAQQHYAACLAEGCASESEGRAYLRTVEAVMACYLSAETGQAIALRREAA